MSYVPLWNTAKRLRSSRVASAIYADLSSKTVCNFRTLFTYFVIDRRLSKIEISTASD